ncbi:MAG: transcriptional regulator, partial [Acidimicrobiaceae bacterium]|nr:transcriptional regulator [Acidimicrobiaceae bacterium]
MMDRIDKRIISLLQQDAGMPAREIAEKVNLTPTPCWRRIQRLENDGVIT